MLQICSAIVGFSSELVRISSELVEFSSELVEFSSELILVISELLIISTLESTLNSDSRLWVSFRNKRRNELLIFSFIGIFVKTDTN